MRGLAGNDRGGDRGGPGAAHCGRQLHEGRLVAAWRAAQARPAPRCCMCRVCRKPGRAGHRMEDSVDCPLCCTELDVTDRAIQYCECGCEPRRRRMAAPPAAA